MKKWIITAATLLAACALALPQRAEAYYDNNPFDASYCGCGFEVGVDFLWWKQAVDNLDFGCCTSTQPFFVQLEDGTKVDDQTIIITLLINMVQVDYEHVQ